MKFVICHLAPFAPQNSSKPVEQHAAQSANHLNVGPQQ
jgi:hypothetical protein